MEGSVAYRHVPDTSGAPDAPEVSVVMPAHNESGLLDQTLKEVIEGLRGADLAFEVLVVENGSTDSTPRRRPRLRAPTTRGRRCSPGPEADYGEALRAGILAATGDVVVVFDVDYYDPGFVDRVLPRPRPRRDGPAIVVGLEAGPGHARHAPWPRRARSPRASRRCCAYGFGLRVSRHPRHEGDAAATVVPIVRAGAATAPTCSTPSWSCAPSAPGSRSRSCR